MADTDKIVEQLSGLTVLEIAGLVKQLEEKWGVSAAAPVAMAEAPAAGGGGAAAPAAEEKTTFEVILKEMGTNKIGVIKEVRSAVPGLGLAEEKARVEGAPKTIKEGVTKAEADELKKKIEAAGAKVEIKYAWHRHVADEKWGDARKPRPGEADSCQRLAARRSLALPISRVRWSLVRRRFAGRPGSTSFRCSRSVFKESGLCGFRIVGDRRLPPPAVMDFRYRKALARETFFLRDAAIRGNKRFR